MIDTKKFTIEIREDKLNLNFINKDDFSQDDCIDMISYLKTNEERKRFEKIEIDFGKTLFEITILLEVLIKNSYLFKNEQTQLVLNLGQLDLENRMNYLRCFSRLKIDNFEINYFKN